MDNTLDKLNAISASLQAHKGQNENDHAHSVSPPEPSLPILPPAEKVDIEPEHRVQLPVHEGDSAIESGPASFKCGQLASMVSIQEALAFLLNETIDIERREVIDTWLNEVSDAVWKIAESIRGGAGKRSPAPVVRR